MSRLILLPLLLLLGCMEVAKPPSPQKLPSFGLEASIKAELTSKASKLSALADQCKAQEMAGASLDDTKKLWNDGYHSIVGNSAEKLHDLASNAMQTATTPETRVSFWNALSKGYSP